MVFSRTLPVLTAVCSCCESLKRTPLFDLSLLSDLSPLSPVANAVVQSALLPSLAAESDKSGHFGALSLKQSCAVSLNDFLVVPS